MNPGRWGWLGVAAVVAIFDGYALARKKTTMSDEFANRRGWGVFIAGGTFAHLVLHHRR
jgi:hypothetical protein